MGNIVLLSGEPRVGKTTALKKIIQMIGEGNCVIGTIFYNKHPDIDEIKKIPGIKIYTLTNDNRNTILEDIFYEIQDMI